MAEKEKNQCDPVEVQRNSLQTSMNWRNTVNKTEPKSLHGDVRLIQPKCLQRQRCTHSGATLQLEIQKPTCFKWNKKWLQDETWDLLFTPESTFPPKENVDLSII